MPNSSLGQVHYIYCDLHHTWADRNFTQFVPQLMRGAMTCSNDPDYHTGGCEHEEAWYIQAQYIWSEKVGSSTAKGEVRGWVGEMIKVTPGQTILTSIRYEPCGGTMGWSLHIWPMGGDSNSSLCVTTPFMGRNAAYSAPYASGGTEDYWKLMMGDLHEAWNMDSPGYYPTYMQLSVSYFGEDGASINAGLTEKNECVDHVTEDSCENNVMTPFIAVNVADSLIFGINRYEALI